jgi:RNA recognition motif-containing protein
VIWYNLFFLIADIVDRNYDTYIYLHCTTEHNMTKIFVGGFPLNYTELDIVMLVAPHAEVVTIKIVRDKKTKICKGYAFLEIADRAGAENAVEMVDGTIVAGKPLSVKIREDEPVAAPKRYSGSSGSSSSFERKKRPRRAM